MTVGGPPSYGVERGSELAYIHRFPTAEACNRWVYVGQQLGKDRAVVRTTDPVVQAAMLAGFENGVAGVEVSPDLKRAQPAIVVPIEDPPLRAYRRLYEGPGYELWEHERKPWRVLLGVRDPRGGPRWWLFVNRPH